MPAVSQSICGMLKVDQHLDKHPDNGTQKVINKLHFEEMSSYSNNIKYSKVSEI